MTLSGLIKRLAIWSLCWDMISWLSSVLLQSMLLVGLLTGEWQGREYIYFQIAVKLPTGSTVRWFRAG